MFGWQVKFAVLFMKLEGEKEMVRKTITVNLAKNEMQRFFFIGQPVLSQSRSYANSPRYSISSTVRPRCTLSLCSGKRSLDQKRSDSVTYYGIILPTTALKEPNLLSKKTTKRGKGGQKLPF